MGRYGAAHSHIAAALDLRLGILADCSHTFHFVGGDRRSLHLGIRNCFDHIGHTLSASMEAHIDDRNPLDENSILAAKDVGTTLAENDMTYVDYILTAFHSRALDVDKSHLVAYNSHAYPCVHHTEAYSLDHTSVDLQDWMPLRA